MITAIIIAGGKGTRMGLEVPKQFYEIEGKPIIAYTLQNFENHAQVNSIGVVCIEDYQDELRALAREYGITKLDWVIPGGDSAQESIFLGVQRLDGVCRPDDIVIIHDGIRPLVDEEVLTSVIETCRVHGNGVTSTPYEGQIFEIDARQYGTSTKFIPQETLRRVATPQAYRFDVLLRRYRQAFDECKGIGSSSYTNTMMVDLGERLYFAAGSDRNIKLTTPGDLALFRARLQEADPWD